MTDTITTHWKKTGIAATFSRESRVDFSVNDDVSHLNAFRAKLAGHALRERDLSFDSMAR